MKGMKKSIYLVGLGLMLAVCVTACKKANQDSDDTYSNEEVVDLSELEDISEPEVPDTICPKTTLLYVGDIRVFELEGGVENKVEGGMILFEAGLSVDADGAPRAYHPSDDSKALDYLENGGEEGNWWAVATDDGTLSGTPIIQGEGDPAPGFYVSMTSLSDPTKDRTKPERYVNSEKINYIVLPPQLASLVRLGDMAAVYSTKTKKLAYATFADVGPDDHLGEGSIALAEALGLNSSAKSGGIDGGVRYLVFPSTSRGFPKAQEEINKVTGYVFEAWGGVDRITACQLE